MPALLPAQRRSLPPDHLPGDKNGKGGCGSCEQTPQKMMWTSRDGMHGFSTLAGLRE